MPTATGQPASPEGALWLQALIQQMPAAVWTVDTELRFTSFHGAGLAALDMRPNQIIGQRLHDFFGTNDPELPVVAAHLRGLRGESTTYEQEWAGRVFHSHVEPLRDREGRITGCVGTALDITERKRAEQALRESQAMLAKAQEIAHMGSWEWDLATNRVVWSDELLRIFGIDPKEFGGSLEYVLMHTGVHPDDRARLRAATERALATKVPQPLEYRIVRPDGAERTVWADGEFLFDAKGNAVRMVGTIQDITDQKRVEEALRKAHDEMERQVGERTRELTAANEALQKSEAKFRTLAETVAAAAFIIDGDALVDANAAAQRMTGFSREELLCMKFSDLVEPEFQNVAREWGGFHAVGQAALPHREVRLRTSQGESRWVEFTAGRIEFQGKPAVLGTAFDITERKRAEDALFDSETKHRAVLNAIPDSILRFRLDGPIINFKPARGLTPGAAYSGVSDLAKHLVHCGRRAARSGETEIFDYQVQVNGMLRDFEARVVASEGEEAVAILRDVTERKRMEREILEISDREQRRIGQDLHDGLCQHLTGTAFAAKLLHEKLVEKSRIEAKDAREIGDLIEQAITEARQLARGLYPVQLEFGGLVPALEQLAANVEDLFHVSCKCRFDPNVQIRDHVVATHLYRIAQEAINNSIKHGRARHLKLSLGRAGGLTTLKIADDGVGFPKKLPPKAGMGLSIMNYRARIIAATVAVQRARRGTVVTCIFRHPSERGPKAQDDKTR